MIDFSTLKGLTIPEGVVKQITDSLGRVLWSMSQPVTVTLTGAVSNSYVEYNGTRYMFPSTFEANTGDTINFHCGDVPSSATIYLNNNQVASGQSSVNHSYTVTCDLNVNLQTSGSGSSVQAKMYITEIPEGHALVTIAGGTSGLSVVQYTVEIDGNSYTLATNNPAFNTVTTSASKMIVKIVQGLGNSTVMLNGETVHTGLGECVIDLSDATHVNVVGLASAINITTYNINAIKDVTITVTGAGYSGLAQIEHNGIVYTGATTFTAKTGDLIRVSAKNPTSGNSDYYYFVTSDAVFNMNYQTSGSGGANGSVGITTIPEGHILLTVSGTPNASYAYYTLDGAQRTNTGMFAIAPDSVLTVYVDENITLASHLGKRKATITLNGTTVVENDMSGNYTIPLGDAPEIKLNFTSNNYTSNGETSYWGVCNITAIPEGHALVQITGSGSPTHSYVEIDGVKYTSFTTLAVPIGTVMTCHVSDKYEDGEQSLTVNGVELAKGAERGRFDYEHTVSKNVSIYLTYTASIDKVYGTLSITE